jgi:alkyl hydroperoxide reductase subunit D
MEALQHDTLANFLKDLRIDLAHQNAGLQKLVAADSRFLKDLKLNVTAVLGGQNINRMEALLLALSVAANEKNDTLIRSFQELAAAEGATDAELAETHACASVMAANNIFYRFRHYMHTNEHYNNTPAGLRMSVMMSPVLGKELFELMSLVVSAVNGCERCVTSHEASVKQHGASEPRIYDAMRLAAVIRSLCVII